MDPDDQSDTIAFLTDPATYAVDRDAVETRRTHISLVVLAGPRALKLKLAVKLPYLDFSSAARRLQDSEREVALNRRTAPAIYRGVRRITREADGRLMFDGRGRLVDAVVEMRRFDEGALFEHLAEQHALTAPMLDALAGEIARLHASATPDTRRGGAETVRAVLAINECAFAGAGLFRAEEVSRLNSAFRSALDLHAPLLDQRGETGRIRLCHGDLHLRNICLIDGAPVLFDCLEFDDALATMDTLYDLAFLLMDLWHRGLRAEANRVFNRYFDIADDTHGLPLLPFFMALRAAVRAHVGATRMSAASAAERATLAEEARRYFDLAERLLQPVPPRLVAIAGYSGTGKSTLAAGIADHFGAAPGARILNSDRIRKEMAGVAPGDPLPAAMYRQDVSDQVYRSLSDRVGAIVSGGMAAIADAVFARPQDRERIVAAAARHAVPFLGLWLYAPEDVLQARVAARRDDVSDADSTVVRAQLAAGHGALDWIVVPAEQDRDVTRDTVLAILQTKHPAIEQRSDTEPSGHASVRPVPTCQAQNNES